MTESEEYLQYQCYSWYHNLFPEYRGLLCYNFNNSRNERHGNKNKAMGLQKGRSDLVLYYNSKAYMFELKTEEGSLSPAQIKWRELIKSQGFEYYLIRSLDQFVITIENIFNDFKTA